MLAIVKTAKSVRTSLKYNEQKVEQKQARLLDAHNFWQRKEELTTRDKWQRFHDLTVLNERSQKQAVHISLNFPRQDLLTDQHMTSIATDFMRGIGFAEQPWLVYRHVDAAHPHMHIVTTNIRPDGSRIKNDLRSPNHLKQLCYMLEERHALTPAIRMPDLSNKEQTPTRTRDTEHQVRVRYGKAPTSSELARVVDFVVHQYAYISFEALNAALGKYNVRADRGREDSPMYNNKGLYYRVIDDEGKKLGAPIKASALHLPVTLPYLEKRFRTNVAKVNEKMVCIRQNVEWALWRVTEPYSVALFREELKPKGVDFTISDLSRRTSVQSPASQFKPDDGHGFYFIDYESRTVVRDTQLGKACTARAILQSTGIEEDMYRLIAGRQLSITNAEKRALLRPGYQNPAAIRNVLLQLSSRHDAIVDRIWSRQQEQELSLYQGHGLGRSR